MATVRSKIAERKLCMANKRLINQCKAMYQQIQQITPSIYSAMAIALHRHGASFEEIESIFAESQLIWNECVQKDINMPEMCFEETGIDVLREVNQ